MWFSKGFINRCPMLITSQKELRFPADDQEAMDARLTTYKFKALPRKDPQAHEWLKSHPVECIAWAIRKAGEHPKHNYSNTGNDLQMTFTTVR